MFEVITRGAPEFRRSVPLDPASPATILPGQVCQIASGYAVLADGASVVAAPLWAFTKSTRLDAAVSNSVSVVEAPFSARVNTDGYNGSPVAGNPLKLGTTTNVGKLVVQTVTADATTLQAVVAYCTKAPDADGVIEIKVIR